MPLNVFNSMVPYENPFKDDFKFENMIGRGSFGIVFKCVLIETGEVFAAKVLCKKDIIASDMSKYVTNEKAILSHLDSPFIGKFL